MPSRLHSFLHMCSLLGVPFVATVTVVAAGALAPLQAQIDYYNTDAGRPITVEDAYPVEYRALEMQLAPLRLERSRAGVYQWTIEPEITAGLLPRTHISVGIPLTFLDGAGRRSAGLAGIEIGAFHNLNVETRIPAFAVAGDVLLPVGGLAPDRAYASVKGIATRTLPWARFHWNVQYTFGDRIDEIAASEDDPAPVQAIFELSRWMAGAAVDRAFPLQSFLVTGELVARQPMVAGENIEWSTAAGMRYQVTPRIVADGGAGYRLTGHHRGWFLTAGAAVAVGLPWSP